MIWMDNALAKIIFLLITKNILIIKYIHSDGHPKSLTRNKNLTIASMYKRFQDTILDLKKFKKKIEIESTKCRKAAALSRCD